MPFYLIGEDEQIIAQTKKWGWHTISLINGLTTHLLDMTRRNDYIQHHFIR